MLKITHANNQKKSAKKKIWGCLQRQVTTCLRRQPHPPPPPPKKKPQFFSKKSYVKPIISIFSAFILTLSQKNALLRALLPLSWGQNKETSIVNTKRKQKKIGENSSIEAFFAIQVSHKPERVLKITHANNQKKIGQKKNLKLPPKTGYNLSSETTPPPLPKLNPNFFSKKCYVKPIISIFSAFTMTLSK